MENPVNIKYTEYIEYRDFSEIVKLETAPYTLKDLGDVLKRFDWSTPVIYIEEAFVDKILRDEGMGTKLIQDLCSRFPDHLILIEAVALRGEYKDFPEHRYEVNIINELGDWYEKLGFVDVNQYLGQSPTRIAYLYYNEVGIEFIVELDKTYKETHLKDTLIELENCKDVVLSLYPEEDSMVSREGVRDYVLNGLNHILNRQVLTSDEIPNIVNICHQLLGVDMNEGDFSWVGSTIVGLDKTILSINLRLNK